MNEMKPKRYKTIAVLIIFCITFLSIFNYLGNDSYAKSNSNEIIGEFFIFSSPTFVDSAFGHAWIGIINETSNDITVGNKVLKPGEICTLGRFKSSYADLGKGVYYNYECYRQSIDDFRENVYAFVNFTRNDLKELNAFLNNIDPNTYNVVNNNCCHFAVAAWNACVSEHYEFEYTRYPTTLADYISEIDKKDVYVSYGYVLPYRPYRHY